MELFVKSILKLQNLPISATIKLIMDIKLSGISSLQAMDRSCDGVGWITKYPVTSVSLHATEH